MKSNTHRVKTLYLKEMRDTFRDRGTILAVFVLPLILFPILFIISGIWAHRMLEEEKNLVARVSAANLGNDSQLRTELGKSPKFHLVDSSLADDGVKTGKVLIALAASQELEKAIAEERPASLKILFDGANRMSVKAKQMMLEFLDEYRQHVIATRLEKRDLNSSVLEVFEVTEESVASAQKMGGFVLGIIVPYLLIVLLFAASMNTATDLTAGEKERKTIETLLVADISRREIVLGKMGAVITVGLISAAMGFVGLVGSVYTGFTTLTAGTEVKLAIAPIPVLFAMLMLLPIGCLFGAVMTMIGSFARSAKESNSHASYLLIAVALLGMTSVMRRGAEASIESYLIPVVNTTLVQQELLMGVVNWPHIGLTILTTGVLAILAFVVAVALFMNERVLFRV